VQDYVFPLVGNVVVLEAEEGAKPVEEVHAVLPLCKWRLSEVSDSAEGSGGSADLWKAE
jgi:hypothetical protein